MKTTLSLSAYGVFTLRLEPENKTEELILEAMDPDKFQGPSISIRRKSHDSPYCSAHNDPVTAVCISLRPKVDKIGPQD